MLKKLHLLAVFITACLIAVVINSCKKDLHTDPPNTVSDPAIAQAKSWYESTYPTGGKLSSQATTGNKDLSQLIKPDWQHPSTYTRSNKNVIELPLDASVKFSSAVWNKTKGQTSNRAYSKSSYILLSNGNSFDAYIMTIIADSAYIKNDLSKLARNTYKKHEADFSGLVLYFTPNGKYVSGWRYKDGHIVGPGADTSNKKVQDIASPKLTPHNMEPTEDCIDWFWVTYENGVAIDYQYLYTTCATPGQGGGGDGNPCPGTNGVRGPVINNMPPPPPPGGGDDGTFPPPTGPSGSPCSMDVPPTTPNFGLDANCLNCRISDDNFDNLLNYLDGQGISYTNPYNDVWTIDGVQYKGQTTDIKQPNGDVVHYFSPDVTSGPFQTGIEYNLGTSVANSNIVNTTTNINLGGIEIGPSSTYLGNGPVTFTPTGGVGGAILTVAQRKALETADNQRLINLMNQEDARDDAAMSPCHGTARNGNVKWPGTAEHWLIQYDYMFSNPLAMREYFIPGSSGKLNGNPGYADIVNPASGEMFEIKPFSTTGQAAGAAEIQLYVTQANALCPRIVGGGWSAGTNYTQRYLPDPKNPSNLLWSRLSSSGVIVYSSVSRNGAPQVVPVLLPENLTEKLKKLVKDIQANPSMQQQLVINFVRQNPKIVPYLKGAAAGVVIASILEDFASEGLGILDDWQSFLIARMLWRVANGIVLI